MALPNIETERLVLRTFRQEDLEAVFLLCSDPDVIRFFSADYKISRENVLSSLPRRRERWRLQGFGQLGVFKKKNGKLIGYCGLQYLETSQEVEIYYGFHKEYWRMGFALEAAKAVLRFAFDNLKLDRVCAVAHPENFASHKVLSNLGFLQGGDANFYNTRVAYFSLDKKDFKRSENFFNLRFEEIE